jgi:ATP-dependent DNA helicase RecG
MSDPMPVTPESSLTALAGVGPKRAGRLAEAGFRSVVSLLRHLPRRYEDRRTISPVGELADPKLAGRAVTVVARVSGLSRVWTRRRGAALVRGEIHDTTGQLPAVWFHRPYLVNQLDETTEYLLHGRLRERSGGLEMVNPSCEPAAQALLAGAIVPIYPALAGIGPGILRRWIAAALASLSGDSLPDPIPAALRRKHGLPALAEALSQLHEPHPGSDVEALNQRRSTAHRRLAYGELLALQTELARRRGELLSSDKPHRYERPEAALERWEKALPFELTGAQKRCLAEIASDLAGRSPMQRLLQGDVGSGKTAVAALAMVVAAEGGCQAALMAPTELLAEQHQRSLTAILGRRYRIGLLTASAPGAAEDRRELAAGRLRLVVGTHALIEERVALPDLGLVVIDEQHRFGVAQRRLLQEKGGQPDLLVMTATPIPRSLALTVYGDLSLSVIDELPPGRAPVATRLEPEKRRPQIYERLAERLAVGGQAYVVLPLIEESEQVAAASIERLGEELRLRLAAWQPAVLHGRSGAEERARTMREFAAGACRVLIATTVIEVGVDVPAAHSMVIENAERFGLAQLHQLRGRIGRGSGLDSLGGECVAVHGKLSEESRRRLEVFVASRDGFEIAEADLGIRGPGDLLGVRQAGLPELRLADLVRDRDLLEAARSDAAALLADPASGEAFLERVRRRAERRGLLSRPREGG